MVSKNLSFLQKHLDKALAMPLMNFGEKSTYRKRGIYFIYHGTRVIYIGKTTRTGSQRLSEIAHHYKSHTLHKKLLCEELQRITGNDFTKFRRETEKKFLEEMILTPEQLATASTTIRNHVRTELKFRFYEFENDRLTSLEHFAIAVFNPKYND